MEPLLTIESGAPPTVSPRLHLALIAPDSLTGYATQLQQSLLNILHAQKDDGEHTAALAATAASLPPLDVVSLYIQLPEESTADFIYRLQQGALPQHISLTHISGPHSLQHFDDNEDAEEDADDHDYEREEDEHAEGSEAEEEVRSWRVVDESVPAYSREWHSPSDEESVDEDEAETEEYNDEHEMPLPPLTPRHLRLHEDKEGEEQASVELLSDSDSEREAEHEADVEQGEEGKEAEAGRQTALSVLQTVQHGLARLASQHRRDEAEADETEATAHPIQQPRTLSPAFFHSDLHAHDPPAVSSSSVPPLDLSRLLSSGSHHINLLLYDGVREDIAFSYFQFLQQLSTQLKLQPTPSPSSQSPTSASPTPTPTLYIPPTVLLLYNGWQILHRCEQDEETEERIKKLLNLCDVVVVQDEELCAAYRQLCPTVEVIPHGYAQRCECADEGGERDRDASVAMSPLSSVSSTASTASLASTASSASSLLFSSIPRAPVSSPACSPPLSPRLSSSPHVSLSSATSALSSFSSPDILSAVHRKRDRLHAPVVPFFSSALPAPHSSCNLASLITPVDSASSGRPPIHVIGYIPTDDDTDESHSVSWPDVWQLHHALLDLTASSPTPPSPYLFFLHGAPITAAEEPFVVFLTASHLEQHYSGSYTDLHTFRQFLYSLSADGRRVIVVYGMFVRAEVVALCEQLLSFEVRVSRDVDDAGWVGGRMERSVPVVLELSNCLALRRQGAEVVVINRADKLLAVENGAAAAEDEVEQQEHESSCACETEETFSPDSCPPSPQSLPSSLDSTTDSFSFSPSYHLYPSDKYDYTGAAQQLLSLMQQPGAVEAALQRNCAVKREWSMEVVACMYLRLMQRELVIRGKGAGREGAVVTQAEWYRRNGG